MKLLPYAIGNLVGSLFMAALIYDWYTPMIVIVWMLLLFPISWWEKVALKQSENDIDRTQEHDALCHMRIYRDITNGMTPIGVKCTCADVKQ